MTQTILDTPTHKVVVANGDLNAIKNYYVKPKDVLQAFPSIAYAELKDYSYDTNKSLDNRGNAYKILDILKGGEPVDALSQTWQNLMSWAVSELTNFTESDVTNINNILGVPNV